ncbi:MAG: Ig-like domain-containing protein, partial [Bradymonadaceae bacterium]
MGAEAQLTAPDRYEATATVTVTVTNQDGGSASADLLVKTGANVAPVISEVSASPNPAKPGSEVELTVEAVDDRDDTLSYTWSAPEGWSVSGEGAEVTLATPEDQGGSLADVSVTVSDGYGMSAQADTRVQLKKNVPPNISSVTATPPQVAPGKTLTLAVDAGDPEDGGLTYDWQLPGEWSASGTDKATVEVKAPDTYGAVGEARITVTDSEGATATGKVIVSTLENDGPTISSLTADPSSVAKGGTIALSVQASDPNGDSLQYSWSVADPQAWTLTGKGTEASLESPEQPGESVKVEVVVTDAEQKEARASVVVSTRSNRAPSVATVTAKPRTVSPNATVTLKAEASDPEGDQLSYEWSAPNGWSKSGSGAEIELTAPNAYGESGVARVTVSDGFGGTARGSVLVRTEQNQSPVLSALTANPQSVAPGGKVTVRATANDPNGDNLSYNWTPPSGWSKSGSGKKITLTAPGSYGKSGLVDVTIEDGHGQSASGSVLVETARNQSPVISNVSGQPVIVEPGKTTTVSAQASDPNGDPLNYSWTVPSGWT